MEKSSQLQFNGPKIMLKFFTQTNKSLTLKLFVSMNMAINFNN